MPPERLVVCGVALDFADPAEKANALAAPREDVDSFAEFHG